MSDETQKAPGKLRLPEGAIAPACVAALRNIVGHARLQLVAPNMAPETRVHEYRKAMRRARSLMRILRPSLSNRVARDLERPIADAHRRMSDARDATMMIETWRAFAERHHIDPDEVTAALGEIAVAPKKPDLGPPRSEFDRVYAVLDAKLPAEMNTDDLRRGLQATYKRARTLLARVDNVRDPEHVHAFRRRIKDLAYQLELLSSLSTRAGKWRWKFSRCATNLGAITDLYLMRDSLDRACEHQPTLLGPVLKREIDRAIDAEVTDGLDELLPTLRDLLSRKPAKFSGRFGL